MANLPSAGLRARVALDKNGFKTTKSLGQNFLLDDKLLVYLVESIGVHDEENVLEIGPGAGVMTSVLAERAKHVVSVELDEKLKPVLSDMLAPYDNIDVVYGDFMKQDLPALIQAYFGTETYRVVANLPYYITADILQRLTTSDRPPEGIGIMVQREAAERIMSKPGSKQWCALAALVQSYGLAEVISDVPAEAFEPAPHVTSSFITIDRWDVPKVDPKDRKLYYKVIQSAFAMRRKTLTNNLKASFGITQEQAIHILNSVGLPEKVRGEALSLEQLSLVSDALYNMK